MPLWLCAVAGVVIKSGRSCHADEISFRQKSNDCDAAKSDQFRRQRTAIVGRLVDSP